MNKKEKKQYAYLLFTRESLTQKEIAARVHVTEKTVGAWKDEGKWERLSASLMMTREAQINMLYDQLNNLNVDINQRELGKRKASASEADSIIKLTAAIKNLQVETGISELVSVGKEICDFVRTTDTKKAQELADWIDAFIKTKLTK